MKCVKSTAAEIHPYGVFIYAYSATNPTLTVHVLVYLLKKITECVKFVNCKKRIKKRITQVFFFLNNFSLLTDLIYIYFFLYIGQIF